jgi:RND family efflux transporter MFP subunit
MELRAPIAGVLNSVAAGPGEVVAANQPVFSVLNPETVWIEASIPESGLARLSKAKDAAVELPGEPGRFNPITGDGRGQLLSLGLEVDPATRTVPLLFETANRGGQLRVGQYVTLHVETARVDEWVAVPESALIEEGDQLVSFVQVSGETFQKRELKVGIRDSGFVQVLEGIKAGERVVTKGAYAIRLSSISGVIPAHGHAH